MQAHPAWPALDWLKKRSEEALLRRSQERCASSRAYFSGADPETPAGKLALARALQTMAKTSEAAAARARGVA